MKKKRGIITAAVFIALVVLLNNLLNFMLVQPGLTRTMFHELTQENRECIILGASHGSYGLSAQELD